MYMPLIILAIQTEVIVFGTEEVWNDATNLSYLRLVLGCN